MTSQSLPPESPFGSVSNSIQTADRLLGRKLMLPLFILALGVIAVTGFAIFFSFKQERDKEIARLETIADLKLGQLEIWLRERRGDAEYVGNSPYLQGLADSWRQRGDRDARDRLLERIDQVRSAFSYGGVYFYDGNRQILQSQQRQSDIEPELQSALKEAIESSKIKYVGPHVDRNGRVFLDFIAPLASAKSATGAAIVLRNDAAQFLFPMLAAWPYPSPTGENVLVRRDGDQVAFLNNLKFKPGLATRLRRPLSDSRVIAVQAINSESRRGSLIEGIDYRHVPALGVVRSVKGTDWLLVTKLDLTEVDGAGYRNALWISLAGLLALIVIGSVAIALRQRYQLLDASIERSDQQKQIRSLQLLDAIAKSSPDAIYAKDLNGNYIMCNAETARILERDSNSILGRDDMAILPYEIAAKLIANDQAVLAGGKTLIFDETFKSEKENEFFQSIKGPLLDLSGKVIGIFGVSRNITKQKESEQRLKESEERFRSLFEDTRQPIMVIENGVFTACNHAALAILKMERIDQIVGHAPDEISPEYQPDGRLSSEKARKIIEETLENGSNDFEWEHIRADGEHFFVRVLLTSINDGERRLLHVAWSDITAQKVAEKQVMDYQRDLEHRVVKRTEELSAASESLKKSNEEQLAIFDAATIGIVLTNNRIIERCNKSMEEIFGYEPGELIGKSTLIFYRDKSIFDEVASNMLSEIAKQGFYRQEQRVFRKDGSCIWARLSARPLDPDDLTKGLAGTFEDITLERSALEEMEKAKTLAEETAAAKANFLANMSHEIRTPMNAIMGMTHLALNANPEPRIAYFLQKVIISSRHLLGIINDILDFSKIEAGKMPIEKVNFELEAVIDNASGLISESAAAKNLEIIVDITDDVPLHLVGDPLRIQQVLVNFLSNAVKFTEQGEISIRVSNLRTFDNDLLLKFSVRDSGIGIPDEKRQHLFESFEQVDSSTTRKYGGTGLGLAIAKRLAEAMGGDIGVESQSGAGSTFWFTARLGKGSRQSKSMASRISVKNRRILIVDDHQEARQIIESMVRSLGCDVTAAASGVEALIELRRAITEGIHYDIVFLDWKMPEMDGISVAEQIRQLPLEKQPVILMVTAYDRDECMRAADRLGINDVLIKPVTPSSLFNTIVRVLTETITPGDERHATHGKTVAPTKTLSGVRALLVEDNELNQEVATEILREFGLIVDIAPNGAIAIEMANKGDYNIILMDVQMPVMDGLTATRQLRRDPRFGDVPILAMTASVMKEDQDACISAGMNDHIAKPIDPTQLEGLLIKWLPNHAKPQTEPAPELEVLQTSDAEEPFLEQIAGLDTVTGLHRVRGKRDLYCSLLRKFVHGERDASANIASAIASGEMLEAERLAHTLKGVSGNIGAHEVQKVATELESALRERRSPPQLKHYCETLNQRLDDLIRAIEHNLPAVVEKPPVQIDAEELTVVCQRLADALTESEVCASDFFVENSELLAAAFPRHYPMLKKNIEAYDYEAAAKTLRDAQLSMS